MKGSETSKSSPKLGLIRIIHLCLTRFKAQAYQQIKKRENIGVD